MRRVTRGRGLLNRLIDALPFELHLPGYQYCGPGSKLKDRLERGNIGINPLDQACREHDIAYSKHKDTASRRVADRILADKAWARYNSKEVPVGEKLASWAVTSAMNAKTKMGAGKRVRRRVGGVKKAKMGAGRRYKKVSAPKRKKKPVPRRQYTFTDIMRQARSAIRGSGVRYSRGKKSEARLVRQAASSALRAIRLMRKGRRGAFSHMKRRERMLAIPRSGGVLPLLPIFAGLSALGSLAGGAAGVAKAINEARDAKKRLNEVQRHNETMESIALRQGRGLYFRPYKKGLGLYMTPYQRSPKNL